MKQAESDSHVSNLGKLVVNLQALEFALRAFLVNEEIARGASFSQSKDLYQMNEGEVVPENAFTSYDHLGDLINKYNNNAKVVSAGLAIEHNLVRIRDAIAHGRVSSDTPSGCLRLLKFGKPKNKKVKVTFSVMMTKEWFGEQIKKVYSAVLTVTEANNRLQSGKL